MFKLIGIAFALMAVVSAFPSDLERPGQGNHQRNVVIPMPDQPNGVPQPSPIAVSDEANKEGLENAETFGFGYHSYYPRSYYGGYGGYGGFGGYGGYGGFGGYPQYYHGHARYYY